MTTDTASRPSERSSAQDRSIENRRIVIAAALFALLLICGAALFVHAVRTIPDVLLNYYPVP
jgi:hypothetical protein